jgi:pyruvate dehydrogenase E2 component (dihydrolipoamide acetyltransferase)
MSTQIKLPSLGEHIESAGVLSILVKEGDVIAKDQDLLEIETDKATMPIPAPEAGRVAKVLVAEGDTIAIGQAMFEIEPEAGAKKKEGNAAEEKPAAKPAQKKKDKPAPASDETEAEEAEDADVDEHDEFIPNADEMQDDDEAPPSKKAPEKAKASKIPAPPPEEPPVVVAPDEESKKPAKAQAAPATAARPAKKSTAKAPSDDVPGDGQSSAAAGPAVRRLARVLGVELRRVRPSGEGGRITEDDVRKHVRKSQAEAEAKVIKGVTPPGKPDSDKHGGVRREKMSRIRQTIAKNMLASYTTIPQLTNFDDVDLTELERLREESQHDYSARGIKLTTMPFLVKACAVALKHHPVVNSSIGGEDDGEIVYKEYINIGIAVDTERGLMVPVLRDADRKNIPQIAGELVELAAKARDGSLALDDFQGGTFTISNLGSIGGTYSTPIINPPQVAILLAGRSRMLPQWIEDQWQPRIMLPLSISYDHRVVDGAAAARFLNDVKGYVANPGRLLLAP